MLFIYQKTQHRRRLSPPKYKRYKSYKLYLQHEFERLCVYCRQPDSSAPNLNFGVDHYRPKSRFPGLSVEYGNLYYCCGSCNSRKNNYWPDDDKKGPLIPNPCEHVMHAHLRFEAATGKVVARSDHGRYAIELLQLNDVELIEYRKTTIHMVSLLEEQVEQAQAGLDEAERKYVKGKITKQQRDEFVEKLKHVRDTSLKAVRLYSGQIPPRPLPRRGGRPLHSTSP